MNIPLKNFKIYINNEKINHSKRHFSHPGSWHLVALVISRMRKNVDAIIITVNITNFEIQKKQRVSP